MMIRSFHYQRLALFLMLSFISLHLFAQFGVKGAADLMKAKSAFVQEADSFGVVEEAVPFPKMNVAKVYYNKKELAKIEDAKDSLPLHRRLLAQYVHKFGIENFQKDNRLLWLLARDHQLMGDTTRALMMYELAVKHNKGERLSIPTLDSLNITTRSEWVPLSEYYELLEFRKRVDPLIPPKKVLQNMGKTINSDKPDYAPYMHPSDSALLFTSRRGNHEIDDIFSRQNEDLYFSYRNPLTGKWTHAEKLPDSISTKEYNEGSACFSRDAKTLYFTRCNAKDGLGDCDIYEATYEEGKWTKVRRLSSLINSASWDSQPNLSDDGNTMFFASNRQHGFGGVDIYYAQKEADGDWGIAKNIGPVVNTPENEITPFYHSVTQTLYFGSTGQLKTFGLYDIFKSRWTGFQWDEPRNLGPLVNTPGSEYYFAIDGNGDHIYYAKAELSDKSQDKLNFDLYAFDMPMEARPDAVHKLRGYLVDSVTKKPLVGAVMLLDLENGREIAPKTINKSGYFEFDLKNHNKYRIYVVGDNFLTIKKDFNFKQDTTFTLFTESYDRKKPIVFESLDFPENSFEFAASAKPKLDYLARFMKNYPFYLLVIKGHTDSDGSEDYNIKLSQKRADRIKAYIQEKGKLETERLQAEGYGESRPIFPNDTEEHKEKNRRVEFELVWDPRFEDMRKAFLPTKEETTFDDELITGEDDTYDPRAFLKEFEGGEDKEDDGIEKIDLFKDEEYDEDLEKELKDDMFDDKPLSIGSEIGEEEDKN
ncbi:MAG: OmpA family protein [Bacteroidia bacterium]